MSTKNYTGKENERDRSHHVNCRKKRKSESRKRNFKTKKFLAIDQRSGINVDTS